MLIDTDRSDPLEPGRVINQPTLALGDDRTVRRVPRHSETSSSTRDGQVVNDNCAQRPLESTARDLRPRRRRHGGVLPPGASTIRASVAAHSHQQRRRPVPQRLVRQSAGQSIARHSLGSALATPRVRFDNPALDHRPRWFQSLSDSLQTELIETAERGQIGRGEGSVEHVEVFRTVSVRTSILEDLDLYPPNAARTPTTPLLRRAAKPGDSGSAIRCESICIR